MTKKELEKVDRCQYLKWYSGDGTKADMPKGLATVVPIAREEGRFKVIWKYQLLLRETCSKERIVKQLRLKTP